VLKFHITYIKHMYCLGYYVKDPFFPTLLLLFLMCTYLNHLKFNYNVLLTSNLDIIYLFKIKNLVLEVVKIDEGVIKHLKMMRQNYYFLHTICT
jgi:hypothetical protein